ncbi:MAG: hypothetical protein HGA72_00630 [Chlorobiaceae bacterium]|jgi:hypothetical protein|nr:hypothetical protein [Chlorobiaceae bacterium]NTW64554.1 hypothetical protein [Chlorobiaceae bacterium]
MKFFFRDSPALLLCRAALAFSWIYQGAVPKIACRSTGEIDLLGHVIPVYQWACIAVTWMGVAEILFGLYLLVAPKSWAFWLNVLTLISLLVYVAIFEPELFTLPFNPLTLNISLIALSLIAVKELGNKKNAYDAASL